MGKKSVSVFVSLALFVCVFSPAAASNLSSNQIQAILNLLQSFGAPQSIISNVTFALTGTGGGAGTVPKLTRPLSLGMSGSDVSALQQYLKDKGYFTYPTITGYYGSVTANAVAAFQKANGLPAAGVVGPLTLNLFRQLAAQAANNSQASSPSSAPVPIPTPTPVSPTPTGSGSTVGGGGSVISIPSSGQGGSAGGGTGSVSTPQPAPMLPTITFTADKSTILAGDSVTLSWSSTNADSCSASGAWSGGRSTSGSQTIFNLSATSTFTITCIGPGGSMNQSSVVGVRPPPLPVDTTPPFISDVAPSGTLPAGTTNTSLSAQTNESAQCAYGTGATATYPSMTQFPTTGGTSHVAPLPNLLGGSSYTYYVACKDAAGNISTSTRISFSVAQIVIPAPTLTLSANPGSVPWGSSSTLSWSTTNASSCTASGAWSGSQATTGSAVQSNLTTTGTYTLMCTGAGGNVTQTATVVVTGSAPDTSAPTAPAGLTGAAQSPTQIALTWGASTDNVGVVSYQLYRNGAQVTAPSGTSFTDTSLAPGTTYTYWVKATDAAGNVSSSSNSVNITTVALDTTPPSVIITSPSVPPRQARHSSRL
jgi:hypothetical protein